jgi:hypothetical protein
MSTTEHTAKVAEKSANEARSALVSDMQELRKAGHRVVARVGSRLPWVIGGAAVGLVLAGVAVALLRSKRRSAFEAGVPGWLPQAARATAVSVGSILARRLVERVRSKKLPLAPTAHGPA